jgi:hypothetical protein
VAQFGLHGKSEMVQLKPVEVLNKTQGYNEPASVQHDHVHLQVDAALIEQLRAGYAEMNARDNRGAKFIAAPLVTDAAATPVSSPLPCQGDEN